MTLKTRIVDKGIHAMIIALLFLAIGIYSLVTKDKGTITVQEVRYELSPN